MRFLTCLCEFVVLATLPIGAGDRLTMKVSPAVAFAPVDLFIRTFVRRCQLRRVEHRIREARFTERKAQFAVGRGRACGRASD